MATKPSTQGPQTQFSSLDIGEEEEVSHYVGTAGVAALSGAALVSVALLDHPAPLLMTGPAYFISRYYFYYRQRQQALNTIPKSISQLQPVNPSMSFPAARSPVKPQFQSSPSFLLEQPLLNDYRQRRESIDRGVSPRKRTVSQKQLPLIMIRPQKMESLSLIELEDDDGETTPEDSMEYPFDTKDTKRNIMYTIDAEGNTVIKGCTIYKIVEKLTEESGKGASKYGSSFLLTYRSFLTPRQLLDLLIKRYNIPIPIGLSPEEENKFITKYKKHIQLRVWYILKLWTENHFHDFLGDPELINYYRDFVDNCIMRDLDKLAIQLHNILAKQELAVTLKHTSLYERQAVRSTDAPQSILPTVDESNLYITDIHPLEVARQLTLIEYDYYQKIEPKECLNQCWNKPGKETAAPHIIALIDRFNNMNKWVVTEIVQECDIQKRSDLIVQFIKIAGECKSLGNFNSMMGIVSALVSSPVSRLRRTWELIPANISDQFNAEYSRVFERNFKLLRDDVKKSIPPCLPYLGVYMQDLTFIEDGNSDYIMENPHKLINFEKRLMIAKVITDLRLYQQRGYILNSVSSVQSYLQSAISNPNLLDENGSYKKSLEIEPRSKPVMTR